ncbi:MAG: phenylalanine--tRNA ligase subunit beta [Gammaproteobacteria bacterium]|nr:phenylalanine--tRNA ligase subunit beta [Gammaproteobacteria bacterium]MDH3464949.1 phenylalanine--tRNA ligase subunit beta [Gammaproteobacteria bacterium]
MIISEQWLRTWVDPRLSTAELASRLTMAGLQIGAVTATNVLHSKVVVGEVLKVEPHPRADRLQLCTVNVGRSRALRIVCGAPNVAPGCKVPTALIGAALPNGTVITKSRIRDVVSSGILCSGTELGLDDSSDGLLILDIDAKPGLELNTHLQLDDRLLDLELTPNRGDCLSIAGVAREVGALTAVKVSAPAIRPQRARSKSKRPVRLAAPLDCPRYVGRAIENIDMQARTPDWMRQRLTRVGVRPINVVVDVTNYVMLELGQPMHAFDLDAVHGGIVVRHAKQAEGLTLLDETALDFAGGELIIADKRGPIALAGIMGGLYSAINDQSRSIVLEAAYFRPGIVAATARRLGLQTDASHRFERGVDPSGQRLAMERATGLLLSICGGVAGPIVAAEDRSHLPHRRPVRLNYRHIERLLGAKVPAARVDSILRRLGMTVRRGPAGWRVTPPAYRFDISAEHDLIEEVARVQGYDQIPDRVPAVSATHRTPSEQRVADGLIRETLMGRDYFEAITYSFVDPELQSRIEPTIKATALTNPIASNLAVMRTSLWPGLLQALAHNYRRQQRRIRLFELGNVFARQAAAELALIGGVVTGSVWPEQWGLERRDVDFYDIKGDFEALFALTGEADEFAFKAAKHPALQAGQCARIQRGRKHVGWIGRLEPALQRRLDIDAPIFVCELHADAIQSGRRPQFSPTSRYPATRRDLAVVVDESVSAEILLKTVRQAGGRSLRKLELFDVYRGESIDSRRKSLTFSLTFQELSRTLNESDIENIMTRIQQSVQNKLGGELRS